MIDATVLLLTFTDQHNCGPLAMAGLDLNCRTDVDENWWEPVCRVFKKAMKYDVYRGVNLYGICKVNRDILALAETYRPKYVIYPCNFSGIVTEATLRRLHEIGCLVVAYFFDDDVYFEILSKWMIPLVAYAVTGAPGKVEAYEELGARCILAVPMPMSASVFRRLENEQKRHDVTFVGGLHHGRWDYASAIRGFGVPVEIFGGQSHSTKLAYWEVTKIVNQSRINLHFSLNTVSDPPVRQLKGRIFEVPLCGGFLLTEYAPHLERYFELDREIVCFESASEAAAKVRYYLEHSEERNEIAERGYERACRDYTGVKMVTDVFTRIEKDLRENGRPEIGPVGAEITPLRRHDANHAYTCVKALLRSRPPLRDSWRETVELVLATDPAHEEGAKLLRRARFWRDPAGPRGWFRRAGWRVEAALLWRRARMRNVMFGKEEGVISNPGRWLWHRIRRLVKWFYGNRAIAARTLVRLNSLGVKLTGRSSPLSPVDEELNLAVNAVSDATVRKAVQGELMTGWSIDVDSLNWIAAYMKAHGVKRVVEFGSGVSTVALAALCGSGESGETGACRVLSIEQSAEWADNTRRMLAEKGLGGRAEVRHCPLGDRNIDGMPMKGYEWDFSEHSDRLGPEWRADMIFVDGPAASGLSRARAVLDGLQLAADECRIVMDDGFRDDEIASMMCLEQQDHFRFEGVVPVGKGLALGRWCRR